MAQTPQKGAPKPWLKPPKMGSQAMVQTPKKGVPEPWLKLDFVLHIFTCIVLDTLGGYCIGHFRGSSFWTPYGVIVLDTIKF